MTGLERADCSALDGPGAVGYLGWSGFAIQTSPGRWVLIDPPAGAPLPAAGRLNVLLTHGHPEHLGGTLGLLSAPGGVAALNVLASPPLCRHLRRRFRHPEVGLHEVEAGQHLALDEDLRIEVFGWRHMPLFPSSAGPALGHLARLVRRPRRLFAILRRALAGPPAGPMLGFVVATGRRRVIAWGEGLNRRCDPAEVTAHSRGGPDDLLLAGVEPEDEHLLPDLVLASGAGNVILYEPHRLWRRAFDLPGADLEGLRRQLAAEGIRVLPAAY